MGYFYINGHPETPYVHISDIPVDPNGQAPVVVVFRGSSGVELYFVLRQDDKVLFTEMAQTLLLPELSPTSDSHRALAYRLAETSKSVYQELAELETCAQEITKQVEVALEIGKEVRHHISTLQRDANPIRTGSWTVPPLGPLVIDLEPVEAQFAPQQAVQFAAFGGAQVGLEPLQQGQG